MDRPDMTLRPGARPQQGRGLPPDPAWPYPPTPPHGFGPHQGPTQPDTRQQGTGSQQGPGGQSFVRPQGAEPQQEPVAQAFAREQGPGPYETGPQHHPLAQQRPVPQQRAAAQQHPLAQQRPPQQHPLADQRPVPQYRPEPQHPTAQQTYEGDWSDWVNQLPPEPGPEPAPDYFRHEEALANMIDRRPPRSTRRWLPALLGSLGAAALLSAAFTQFKPESQPAAVVSSTPTQAATTPAPSALCPPEPGGNRIQGNGAGSLDTGPSAIFAFQHAYYVTRSGENARTVVAPNASVSAAPAIQQGIDSIPVGTTHCVTISPGAFVGQYLVQITEYRPNSAQAIVYNPQVVTTARVGNKTLITSIGATH